MAHGLRKRYTFDNPKKVIEKPVEKMALVFTITYTAYAEDVNFAEAFSELKQSGKVEIISVETIKTTENLLVDSDNFAPEDEDFNWGDPDY